MTVRARAEDEQFLVLESPHILKVSEVTDLHEFRMTRMVSHLMNELLVSFLRPCHHFSFRFARAPERTRISDRPGEVTSALFLGFVHVDDSWQAPIFSNVRAACLLSLVDLGRVTGLG